MHLLVCVVNNTAVVNEVIATWREIGVTGATVVDSHGTAQADGDQAEVPVFAGFRGLLRSDRQANRTLFAVIEDDDVLQRAMDRAEEICGDLHEPSTGILFAVPVSHARGLRPAGE